MAGFGVRRRLALGMFGLVSATLLVAAAAAPSSGATPRVGAADVAYGSISGTVTSDHLAQVVGGWVDVTPINGTGGGSGAAIDGQGNYTVPYLAPGTYRVQFTSPNDAEQWYGGSVFPAESTPVVVGPGQQVTGVNAVLTTPATISGTAWYQSGWNLPPTQSTPVYVTVAAKDPVSGQIVDMSGGEATRSSNGAYTARGLPAGTFTVQFSSFPTGMDVVFPFTSQFWNGSAMLSGATPITVAAGQAVTGINATLQDAAPLRIAHDYSGDGHPDVLAVNAGGGLFSYMSNGNAGWNSLYVAQVGSGWNGMRLVTAAGDFDGDGHPDLLAVDTTGKLWLYPGNGHNGWLPRKLLATGWQNITALSDAGDFSGTGTDDLLARDGSGVLWLYQGDGTGGLQKAVAVGSGWNGMTSIISGTDFNGDGFPDVIARDGSGILWDYPESHGTWGQRVALGTGWNAMTAIASVGTLTPDQTESVLARDAAGNLWLYSYYTQGKSWDPRVLIGTGWNGMSWIG